MIAAAAFVFFFGAFLGFLGGLKLGGLYLLYRMHHDDVEGAHRNYQNRKAKYIQKDM